MAWPSQRLPTGGKGVPASQEIQKVVGRGSAPAQLLPALRGF